MAYLLRILLNKIMLYMFIRIGIKNIDCLAYFILIFVMNVSKNISNLKN